MSAATIAASVWSGRSPALRAVRLGLMPAGALFRVVAHLRNAMYDHHVLRSTAPAVPALSVGNLTVGGTGKTPIAAWLAGELARRGARPAVVLRGYGDDETLVHSTLNPSAIVVASPDRSSAVAKAVALGADVVVLDDAFQHRRLRRLADIVLLSADAWDDTTCPIPAGPWREPLSALRRAALVIVTRKAATPEAAEHVAAAARGAGTTAPVIHARIALGDLHRLHDDDPRPLDSLGGRQVVAVAGVGDGSAFVRQIADHAASVIPMLFADHHRYDSDDVRAIRDAGGSVIVCTLKDAVKLHPLWPRAGAPLLYVSQRLEWGSARSSLDQIVDRVLAARQPLRDSGRHAPA